MWMALVFSEHTLSIVTRIFAVCEECHWKCITLDILRHEAASDFWCIQWQYAPATRSIQCNAMRLPRGFIG